METISFYVQITLDYLVQMLPCAGVAAAVFFCLMPRRRRALAAQGLKSGPWREGALLVFALFCAGLAALTLFPANFWTYVMHGVPLSELHLRGEGFYWHITLFRDLLGGAWSVFMLLGNVIMFAPLGFFPALLWDKPRWWKSLLIAACASTFVEVTQLFVGRSSDINDIILNALGGLAGFWAYLLLKWIAPRFALKFRCVKVESLRG